LHAAYAQTLRRFYDVSNTMHVNAKRALPHEHEIFVQDDNGLVEGQVEDAFRANEANDLSLALANQDKLVVG
jgi:hypothetical protein